MFRNLCRKLVGNRFSAESHSINPIQYHTKPRNVSRFNKKLENSLTKNVNSSITLPGLCFHTRQLSISSSRNYCEENESEKSAKKFWPLKYDDELEVGFPTLLDVIGIWIKTFKIQSNYMPSFDRREFLEGSRIAIAFLTGKIANGDFDSLRGLVTDELFQQIKDGFGALTFEERQKFIVKIDEMVGCSIKNIDIIEDDDDDTSIEILVVCHAIRNLSEIRESGANDDFLSNNLYVLNYRFVKDVTEEDWTVSSMIHSKLADEMEEQKKKLFKKLEQNPFSQKK